MIDEKQLISLAKEKKIKENKKLSKKDYDRRIANWQLFYLNNLDIFTEEYLKIPLHYFQRQVLLDCWEYDIYMFIASRGLSKSFTIGVLANDLALLLPGVQIAITSLTLGQSNKIIDDKIDKLLSSDKKGISPILKQLRADGYINFTKDKTTGGRVVEYGNGSKIFAVACNETGRGARANITITDEARIVKKRDYESIVEPMLEPYNFNGLMIEPKQIFMTSARTKDNWVWTYLKTVVRKHYTDKRIKYGFFAGDIFTAVANKIQTKNQYLTRRENTNDLDFEMEFLNLWLGETEGSLFLYDDFHKNQVLETAFLPTTNDDYCYNIKNKYDFSHENEIRILTMDIAVSGGRENDNTVFVLGNIDIETNQRKVEYIKAENGLNSQKQIVMIKRLFYDYKCTYFVMDSKGVGNVFFDLLTTETYDDERDITYPAWTVCRDKILQISSDKIINDKINRTMDSNAEEVIIPIAGTSEINSDMHLAMRKNLKDNIISFLKDDSEMELLFQEKDSKWILKSSEKKAYDLVPFVETRYAINEAITLTTEFKDKGVRVKEKSTATKDRYMTLAMFNYFCDKVYIKYVKDEQDAEIDLDDFSDIYDYG
nr:MAG TPA: large terminase [Caudoviricetes sp.]